MPNVIVFFTDQQRWDTSGLYGNPLNLTANFDRFAQSGTHCYNGFTCQPVCLPARLTLQTGKYPSTFDCFNNSGQLPDGHKTLGHYFRDAGYKTGYIGKWHLCHNEPVPQNRRDGYDYWLGANLLEKTSDAYRTIVYDYDNNPVHLPGYRVDALTDAAINYINENKEHPFFLFCSFLEPHHQNARDDYPAPCGYEEKYYDSWMPPDLRELRGSSARHLPGYYGIIKRLDEAFGRLMDALKSLNLLDDTIVLYTSDHGCHFKTRNSEYKRSCHESSVRIPMAFNGPKFKSGGRIQELVSIIDIPPALLDACDIPIPEEMQGRSILPLTCSRVNDWPKEIYVEIFEKNLRFSVRTQRWKYSIRKTEPEPVRGNSWKFTEEFLYDLSSDPYELKNLIAYDSRRNVADVMKQRLVRRMTEAGEREPEIIGKTTVITGRNDLSDNEIYE